MESEKNQEVLVSTPDEIEKPSPTTLQKQKSKSPYIAVAIFYLLIALSILGLCGRDKILTHSTWADTCNYMFAVDVDGFDGDVYEPGIYTFYNSSVRMNEYPQKIPIIWDIYVSNNFYPDVSYLKSEEYAGSVGGITNENIKWSLSSGNYVYIIYNPTVNTPMGILNIEKLNFK